MRKLKLIVGAFALLALAYPSLIPPVLGGIVGAYALLALAYPSLIPPVLGALGFALTVLVAVAGWILANLPV